MEITAEILVGVALILPKLRRKVTLIDDNDLNLSVNILL